MRITALLFALTLAACPAPKLVDPCAENPCGAGLCSAVNGQAFCLCNPGFTLQGSTCVSVSMASCEPNPCTGGKTCSLTNNEVQCACPADLVEDQGRCVSALCAAAHCGQVPHQTVCTVTGTVATCSCESGFVPTATGCSELPVFDCAAQHTGQGADPHAPNECPSQANPLVPSLAQQHTLVPAGDVDWLSLRAAAGHIVEVAASASNGSVVLDVMGSDGLTTLASNHRATPTPSVRLRVPSTNADPLYVRVSSFDASALAAYGRRHLALRADPRRAGRRRGAERRRGDGARGAGHRGPHRDGGGRRREPLPPRARALRDVARRLPRRHLAARARRPRQRPHARHAGDGQRPRHARDLGARRRRRRAQRPGHRQPRLRAELQLDARLPRGGDDQRRRGAAQRRVDVDAQRGLPPGDERHGVPPVLTQHRGRRELVVDVDRHQRRRRG